MSFRHTSSAILPSVGLKNCLSGRCSCVVALAPAKIDRGVRGLSHKDQGWRVPDHRLAQVYFVKCHFVQVPRRCRWYAQVHRQTHLPIESVTR